MGEAKRRRDRAASLQEGMEEIRTEGQGVWNLSIYNLEGVAEMLAKSMAGDAYATKVMRGIAEMIRQVETANPTTLCLLCDNEFTEKSMPEAWVLMHAMRDEPMAAAGNGICAECYSKHGTVPALGPIVFAAYRDKMITDLRVLPPLSQSGTG